MPKKLGIWYVIGKIFQSFNIFTMKPCFIKNFFNEYAKNKFTFDEMYQLWMLAIKKTVLFDPIDINNLLIQEHLYIIINLI